MPNNSDPKDGVDFGEIDDGSQMSGPTTKLFRDRIARAVLIAKEYIYKYLV